MRKIPLGIIPFLSFSGTGMSVEDIFPRTGQICHANEIIVHFVLYSLKAQILNLERS